MVQHRMLAVRAGMLLCRSTHRPLSSIGTERLCRAGKPPAHMQIVLTLAAVRHTMNDSRVRMEVEDDRLVIGEDGLELVILQAVRMLVR